MYTHAHTCAILFMVVKKYYVIFNFGCVLVLVVGFCVQTLCHSSSLVLTPSAKLVICNVAYVEFASSMCTLYCSAKDVVWGRRFYHR